MWDNPRQLNAAAGFLTALALVAFAVALTQLLLRSPLFPLREVRVTGTLAHTTRAQVEAAMLGRLSGNFFAIEQHADGVLDRQVLDERPDLDLRLAFGRQRRELPVRRIDDERRPAVADHVGAVVQPEVVVPAHGDPAAPGRQRLGSDLARLEQPLAPGGRRRLELGRFLLGQKRLVAQPLRALERRLGAEVPHALQVGPSIGRPRKLGGRWGGQGERDGGDDERRETVTAHGDPPWSPVHRIPTGASPPNPPLRPRRDPTPGSGPGPARRARRARSTAA